MTSLSGRIAASIQLGFCYLGEKRERERMGIRQITSSVCH